LDCPPKKGLKAKIIMNGFYDPPRREAIIKGDGGGSSLKDLCREKGKKNGGGLFRSLPESSDPAKRQCKWWRYHLLGSALFAGINSKEGKDFVVGNGYTDGRSLTTYLFRCRDDIKGVVFTYRTPSAALTETKTGTLAGPDFHLFNKSAALLRWEKLDVVWDL